MSRLLCPNCQEELNDNLACFNCLGKYVWKDSTQLMIQRGKEAIKNLRGRNS